MIPLSDAAIRLGVPYRRAYDLLLKGELGKVERRSGRFYVDADAVGDSTKASPVQVIPTARQSLSSWIALWVDCGPWLIEETNEGHPEGWRVWSTQDEAGHWNLSLSGARLVCAALNAAEAGEAP